MKLGKLISSLNSRIKTAKIVKHENNIKKHFQIHDNTLYGNSELQMYNAREVIARFAEKNGVSVDVYDARRLLDDCETVSPVIEDRFSSKLNIVVTNLKNKKQINRVVDANTDIVYPKVATRKILIPVKGEENLQYIRNSVRYTEDNFLRNLYRNIGEMTNIITKPKKQ